MRAAWAASLPASSAEWLAACRHVPGLHVAMTDAAVWVCGPDLDVPGSAILKTVRGIELYEIDDDGRLTPVGKRLSVGVLPRLDWKRLCDEVRPEPPVAGFAARQFQKVSLKLQQSSAERDVNVLIAPGARLLAVADLIPAARLKGWKIAARDGGDVLIWGPALPPLEGQRYWEQAGIAFPAGMAVSPQIPASALAARLRRTPGELLVWFSDGRIERIAAEHFVPATRVSIRTSCGKEPA